MLNYLTVSICPHFRNVSAQEPETLPARESLVSIANRHPLEGLFTLMAVSGLGSLKFRILQEALQ